MARLNLAVGVIGPVLFVIVFLIEGATRHGYNAWRHIVSQWSQSNQGWMQTRTRPAREASMANFIECSV